MNNQKIATQLDSIDLPTGLRCADITQHVRRSGEQNFIIFSDSKSSFEAINNFQVELVQKFIKEYTHG